MNEMIKEWLKNLYNGEIENEKLTISNEHIWENGVNEGEHNFHTDNIKIHEEYIEILENLVKDLDK